MMAAIPIDDFGPNGPAALSRPSRIFGIRGEARGSVGTVRIEVRRYRDECQVDALNTRGQLNDRQWRAGTIFRAKWRTAHGQPRVCASYGETTGRSDALEASERREEARRACSAALDPLPLYHALAVIAVCGQDEACAGRLASLKDGLTALADWLEVPAEYSRGVWVKP